MAKVKIIASGSAGNCYILESLGERLILECGVKYDELLSALDYDVDNVVGVVTSHIHQDHIKRDTAKKLNRVGLKIYGTEQSSKTHTFIVAAKDKMPFELGGFTVMPLSVEHNCENFAYVIDLPGGEGRVIFATDLVRFPYNISDVNFMLIEANYDENIVRTRLLDNNDIWNASENHMEIDTAIDAINRHYTAELKQVVLIHLSSGFSDERAFVESVRGLGVPCVAARSGLELNLELFPF